MITWDFRANLSRYHTRELQVPCQGIHGDETPKNNTEFIIEYQRISKDIIVAVDQRSPEGLEINKEIEWKLIVPIIGIYK